MSYVNEAGWDRILRVILGLVLLGLALTQVVTGAVYIAFIALGAILLLTGLAGFCPLYALLKIRTNKPAKRTARA